LATIRSNACTGASKVSNVQSDWNATSGLAQILNKPTIPSVSTTQVATPGTTTIGINSSSYTIVSKAQPSGSGNEYIAPSWSAMVTCLTAVRNEINSSSVTIYTGTTAPASSTGVNGDIYIQTSGCA